MIYSHIFKESVHSLLSSSLCFAWHLIISLVCSVDRGTIYTTTMSAASPEKYNTLVRPQVITSHLILDCILISQLFPENLRFLFSLLRAVDWTDSDRAVSQRADVLVCLNIMSTYRFIVMWRLYNHWLWKGIGLKHLEGDRALLPLIKEKLLWSFFSPCVPAIYTSSLTKCCLL